MTELVDGSRSFEEVRAMVRAVLPEWTVETVDSAEGCRDGIYPVTVVDGRARRELVLKVPEETAPAAFRPEPYLLDVVARRTDVPVPDVVAVLDDHDDHPPWFLMERCDGQRLDERADALAPAVRDRIARDAGHYLGQLHMLGSFDRFGPVRLCEGPPAGHERSDAAADGGQTLLPWDGEWSLGDPDGGRVDPEQATEWPETDDGVGIEASSFGLDVADAGWRTWRARFRSLVDARLDALDDRFGDLSSGVRAALASVSLPTADPVLAHHDYRYRNLLADPETGETRALVNFEGVATAPARYDLVAAVDSLSVWGSPTGDRRHRIRSRVLDGYEVTTGRRPDLDEPVADVYRIASRLSALADVERGRPGGRVDDRAARRHREHIGTLVERCRDATPE